MTLEICMPIGYNFVVSEGGDDPSAEINELKDDYPNVRIGQWFLDPLNPRGPDYERNKDRILDN